MTAHTCAGCAYCRRVSHLNACWSLYVAGVTL